MALLSRINRVGVLTFYLEGASIYRQMSERKHHAYQARF